MRVLIFGGAGFIGSNAAEFYAKSGNEITIFDNLSRKGTTANLKHLQDKFPYKIEFVHGDIRVKNDLSKLNSILSRTDLVLHLAGQVAVTTSVTNPEEDFEINARGTFNVLEKVREMKEKSGNNPILIYSSTNKVYGGMEDIKIAEKEEEYDYENLPKGIDEKRLLDFHSPYGCSKGTGDQYVRDYARIYGLNTVVMRQSCIYGKRQFGVEDQGWVAWFTIANNLRKPITIYGDGKQVRDVLWVEDLIKAYDLARQNIQISRGKCYNVGGGHSNKMSLLQLIGKLEKNKKFNCSFGDWRPGDQKVCIMDISKAKSELGWEPTISPDEGIKILNEWVKENLNEIKEFFPN